METEIMTQREAATVADILRRERDAAQQALDVIAAWPFDIMGDCVAEARYVASHPAHASVVQFMQLPGIQNGLQKLEKMN